MIIKHVLVNKVENHKRNLCNLHTDVNNNIFHDLFLIQTRFMKNQFQSINIQISHLLYL